jgi:hypothetical protein
MAVAPCAGRTSLGHATAGPYSRLGRDGDRAADGEGARPVGDAQRQIDVGSQVGTQIDDDIIDETLSENFDAVGADGKIGGTVWPRSRKSNVDGF